MKNRVGEVRQATRAAKILVIVTALINACSGEDTSGPPSSNGGAGNADASGATGGANTGGGSPTGGVGGTEPDASTGPQDLGKACPMAAAPGGCSAGLTCIKADPIGGYVCTKSCNTSADCPSNGFCYAAGQTGGDMCARVCTHQVVCVALGTSTSCAARPSTASSKICAQ